MRRNFLAALVLGVLLALALPAPGWGGGNDIVLCQPNTSCNGKRGHLSDPQPIRPSRIVTAAASRPEAPQSRLAWVYELLIRFWGDTLPRFGPAQR